MRAGTGRALTFTLPPESGPNSAILLNILSYGRSRRSQGKRPGPAGSPLPQRPHSSRAGPGGGFLAEGDESAGLRSPRKRQLLAADGVPDAHSAPLSVRSDPEWAAAATLCAGATRSLTLRTRRAVAGCRWADLGWQGPRKPGISSQLVAGPDHLASQCQRNWLLEVMRCRCQSVTVLKLCS